jgi:hypothetical protein
MAYNNDTSVTYKENSLFKLYQEWHEATKEEYIMNTSIFGGRLKIAITDLDESAFDKQRTNKGVRYNIDWQIIRKCLGIESGSSEVFDLDCQV